ncbi:MAG: NAD(P)/FAD-dependent oxidoreductase [Solirubrobacterales bacterium]|nr:NAD(P)/FAD-dependent oxidoreductase [Solirubrobacterales bacterium]
MSDPGADTLQAVPDDPSAPAPASAGAASREPLNVRIAIIGSGFSGIGMAIRLKQAGIEDFVILERADDVGGTWEANTYPGCQCDVPSHLYSFSFELNPSWTRTYSKQPEIWAYLRRCAERYDLHSHLRFGHELTAATWDEQAQRWHVETSRGAFSAQLVIDATGPLSQPALPAIRGLRRFEGKIFHSAQWDHDHDLSGERVAVIGTGASSIQFVPRIQPQVGRLHLFQRTPPWIMPHTDRPTSSFERRLYRRLPIAQRVVRAAVYWTRESYVLAFAKRPALGRGAERIARMHLRRHVRDEHLRRKLQPQFRLGCKRVLLSNEFYPALTQPNVELVTERIAGVEGREILLGDGSRREVDTIILGTGFHVTDPPTARLVRGIGGRTLAQAAGRSPQAYLGTAMAGFPNVFRIIGPNTGLGHNSMVYMIESQLSYVMDAIGTMDARGIGRVEVRPEVVTAFNDEIQEMMQGTVWMSGCQSWYLDADGRNTTLWPDFTFRFRERTRHFDPESYDLRVGVPVPS